MGPGNSSIKDLVAIGGGDPTKVYGCSGYMDIDSGGAYCMGDGRDANGDFVQRDVRERLGLMTCAAKYTKCSYDQSGDP